MTAAQVIEIMATEGKKLSEIVAELPTYFNTKIKVPVSVEPKNVLLDALITLTEGQDRITIDGVKLKFDDGWILMRPSGTEPFWRCFAEASTQKRADDLANEGRLLIKKAMARL